MELYYGFLFLLGAISLREKGPQYRGGVVGYFCLMALNLTFSTHSMGLHTWE